MWTERFAPAKINLFLHVGAVAADGYHPVCSLMVFADIGDTVRLRDHASMAFRLEGPFADALAADPDNLVVRARDRLVAARGGEVAPFEIVLDKALPIAAGLGGGSADAAAALALIAERLAPADSGRVADVDIWAIARGLGADVAACLAARPVIGRGRGDELAAAPGLPALPAVLVNPMVPSPTGPVYRAYDLSARGPRADEPILPQAFETVASVIDMLRETRNDLQAPAIALQPAIGEVLETLAAAPEAAFTRMSGSGATCFAICETAAAAGELAARVAARHPSWWVKACTLAS